MAILPDLDPTQIGVIAFWNAHDHRVDPTSGAVIDPTDVLGVLDSYTLYDNGIDGMINSYGPMSNINVRVKNDGWIIAWVDRTNTYQQIADPYTARGYYDLIYNWKQKYTSYDGTNYSITNITTDTNTLIEIINNLYNQLSNKANFSFVKSDVGTYCYEFPDISTITFADKVNNGSAQANYYLYFKWIITSGTSVKYIALVGSGSPSLAPGPRVTFINSANITISNRLGYGALDLLSYLTYDTEMSVELYTGLLRDCARAALIVMWS